MLDRNYLWLKRIIYITHLRLPQQFQYVIIIHCVSRFCLCLYVYYLLTICNSRSRMSNGCCPCKMQVQVLVSHGLLRLQVEVDWDTQWTHHQSLAISQDLRLILVQTYLVTFHMLFIYQRACLLATYTVCQLSWQMVYAPIHAYMPTQRTLRVGGTGGWAPITANGWSRRVAIFLKSPNRGT